MLHVPAMNGLNTREVLAKDFQPREPPECSVRSWQGLVPCPPCRALLFAREGDLPARPLTLADAELVTGTLATVECGK